MFIAETLLFSVFGFMLMFIISIFNAKVIPTIYLVILYEYGLFLHNPNAVDISRWRGFNLRGKKLMEIRNTLANNG